MKKTIVALISALALVGALCGCNVNINIDGSSSKDVIESIDENEVIESAEEVVEEGTDSDEVTVRVGGLKGPTSIGLLKLKEDDKGQNYDFVMATAADEITTSLVKGELDIALIPANVASILYNKTEGKISVIDINTLGVLYIVATDNSIDEMSDLEGKTVYLTGKGTTPDYVLQYLLTENQLLDKVTLEYKSEATEVAATLAENEDAIGLLPQPFATAACIQNERLSIVMDTTKLWDELQGGSGSRLVTGVTVVRNDFLSENEDAVNMFLADHKNSVQAVTDNLEEVASLAVAEGIIAKEPIAMKAIPNCNITFIEGDEMQAALVGYLEALYNLDPQSVGGTLPSEDFYYKK